MHSIRNKLEKYLAKIYPDTQIDTEHTFGGKITIRINTSEEEAVETNQRINQAVSRATLIWKKLFGKTKTLCGLFHINTMANNLLKPTMNTSFSNLHLTAIANSFQRTKPLIQG